MTSYANRLSCVRSKLSMAHAMSLASFWRANLSEALTEWTKIPEDHVAVNLENYRCGSTACFGGFIPSFERFKNMGISAHPAEGVPVLRLETMYEVITDRAAESLKALFEYEHKLLWVSEHGEDHQIAGMTIPKVLFGRDDLFSPRHGFGSVYESEGAGSDHQIVVHRLQTSLRELQNAVARELDN